MKGPGADLVGRPIMKCTVLEKLAKRQLFGQLSLLTARDVHCIYTRHIKITQTISVYTLNFFLLGWLCKSDSYASETDVEEL
jgi:hypothetical protein